MKTKYSFITLALIMFCLTFSLHAQVETESEFGIKGGLNLANMTVEDANDNTLKSGFHAGIFAKIPLSEQFSIQPEVLYSTKGVKTKYDEEFLGVSIAEGKTTFTLRYIDVPLYVVYNLSNDFNLHLGPYVGFLLSANVDTQAEVLDFINIDDSEEIDRDRFNNIDAGISAGLGFEFESLTVGFNYAIGLTQVAEEGDISETLLGDARNNVIQVYVGIAF